MPEVVTRFAPSPTGALHVGGARTALFSWALARATGGRFLLRLEDTDRARSSEQAADAIKRDMQWLGMRWDEEPLVQSERLGRYNAAIDTLLQQDLAYPAFETPAQLDKLREQAQREKQNYRYLRDPDWDDAARDKALARMKQGARCIIRFNSAPFAKAARHVDDAVLGRVTFPPYQTDDFVLRRHDGYPTYHLAVVVDDHESGVTHVLRGQEHLGNTPKHMALQQALGYRQPTYAHLPVIQNPDGSKLSKRDRDRAARHALHGIMNAKQITLAEYMKGAKLPFDAAYAEEWFRDKQTQLEPAECAALAAALGLQLPEIEVAEFRRNGYLPAAMVNYLALLGWSSGEKNAAGKEVDHFAPEWFAQRFSLGRVGESNARFDRRKLLAFNRAHIKEMDDEDFAEDYRAWAQMFPQPRSAPERPLFFSALRPRCRTLAELTAPEGPGGFVFAGDAEYPFEKKAVYKWLRRGKNAGMARLQEMLAMLEALPESEFNENNIENAVRQFCAAQDIRIGVVAQPLRVAVTGGDTSPPLGATLELLGRASVLARIKRCLKECEEPATN